ncbi:MAG: T9SS type A sorting domain-containing protein, partial [Bacteroidota bacterium]
EFNNPLQFSDVTLLKKELANLGEGEYFWKVRSKISGSSSGENSDYSSTGNFKISGITDVKEDISIPSEFKLFQNYPNPFNPETVIKYQIASSRNMENSIPVTLKIYDVLGKELLTLVNENKPAGTYEIKFDAKRLSSGLYLYKLSAGEFSRTMKMLLIK